MSSHLPLVQELADSSFNDDGLALRWVFERVALDAAPAIGGESVSKREQESEQT